MESRCKITTLSISRYEINEPQLKTQLLLKQVNKIMAESSTRVWWLPIVEERVRQNTINQAQKIKASHQDLDDLDSETVQRLGDLINTGEIDGDMLQTLIPPRNQLPTSTISTGAESSSVDKPELDAQQILSSNFPGDVSGAQSSYDASIVSSSKKDLKKQRKKDRKRVKWLAANQDQTQSSAPAGPTISKGDASAISTKPEHLAYPTNANPSASDSSNALERLEDSIINKPTASAFSTRQEHNLDLPILTKRDVPAKSTEPEHPEYTTNAIPKSSDILNATQHPEHPPEHPPNAIPNTSNILNAPGYPEDSTTAKPDASALSTEPQRPEHPTNAIPTASDILSAPEYLEDPITAKSNASPFSTEPNHLKYRTDTIPNAPEHLEDPTVARLDASPISTEPEHLEHPITTVPNTPEDLERLVIVKHDASAISIESEHPESPSNTVAKSSDISDGPEHTEDPSIAKPNAWAILTKPEHLDHPTFTKPTFSASSTTTEPPEDHIIAKSDPSAVSTEQEHHPDHPLRAKTRFSAKSTKTDHVGNFLIAKPSISVSTRQHSDPGDGGAVKSNLSTRARSDTLQNTTSIQPDFSVAATGLDSILPADLENLLDCRLGGCPAKLSDHDPARVVCSGCGPKTIIRYCSVAHMVADLKQHWQECGHGDLAIKRVVDHTTTPARFGSLCPAIRDSQGTKSYALYRQGLYAILNGGRYTLFDWENGEPTELVWAWTDVRREEMERRVERLLNFALFDQRNKVVVGFLFRLLRQCLQLKSSWGMGTIYALKKQFGEEFGLDVAKVEEDQVCECEWVGDGLAEALHLPACGKLYRRFGPEFRRGGMGGYLEEYEARHWILRAWQQQHAAVSHWSDRVAGKGFEGGVEGTSPVFGPGWTE